jgi:hypothetical protein
MMSIKGGAFFVKLNHVAVWVCDVNGQPVDAVVHIAKKFHVRFLQSFRNGSNVFRLERDVVDLLRFARAPIGKGKPLFERNERPSVG